MLLKRGHYQDRIVKILTSFMKVGKEKEDRLIDLIVEIIVSSTMREYHEIIDSKDEPTPTNKIDD